MSKPVVSRTPFLASLFVDTERTHTRGPSAAIQAAVGAVKLSTLYAVVLANRDGKLHLTDKTTAEDLELAIEPYLSTMAGEWAEAHKPVRKTKVAATAGAGVTPAKPATSATKALKAVVAKVASVTGKAPRSATKADADVVPAKAAPKLGKVRVVSE